MRVLRHWSTSRPASLPQAAHGDHQIRPLEDFHQLVENALMVVRPRLEVFLQYALRLDDGLEGQLLLGHSPLTHPLSPGEQRQRSSRFLGLSPHFLFQHRSQPGVAQAFPV
jgi:hypothetical protein